MADTGSSPGVVEHGLALAPRANYDPAGVDRRRYEVARLRYVEHLIEADIKVALAKLDPPIDCSVATISRDLVAVRKKFRYQLSARGFEAADEVYARLRSFEEREHLCMHAAKEAGCSAADKATLVRAANDAARAAIQLLQDTGLLHKQLGTLIIDDGRKVERVPTGVELSKRFEAITVTDAEIVSEAEIAYRYGDAAEFEKAGRAATDSAGEEEGD